MTVRCTNTIICQEKWKSLDLWDFSWAFLRTCLWAFLLAFLRAFIWAFLLAFYGRLHGRFHGCFYVRFYERFYGHFYERFYGRFYVRLWTHFEHIWFRVQSVMVRNTKENCHFSNFSFVSTVCLIITTRLLFEVEKHILGQSIVWSIQILTGSFVQ